MRSWWSKLNPSEPPYYRHCLGNTTLLLNYPRAKIAKDYLHVRGWWSRVYWQFDQLRPDLQVCGQPKCWCRPSDPVLIPPQKPATPTEAQAAPPTAGACGLWRETEGQKPWVLLVQHSHWARRLSDRPGLLTAHASARRDKKKRGDCDNSPGRKQKRKNLLKHESLDVS